MENGSSLESSPPLEDNPPLESSPALRNPVALRGIELRYVLTVALSTNGQMTVAELCDELARLGFSFDGRPSKVISDALRGEVRMGRAVRYGRGLYGPGGMPRATEHRIWRRVIELRQRVSDRWWDYVE